MSIHREIKVTLILHQGLFLFIAVHHINPHLVNAHRIADYWVHISSWNTYNRIPIRKAEGTFSQCMTFILCIFWDISLPLTLSQFFELIVHLFHKYFVEKRKQRSIRIKNSGWTIPFSKFQTYIMLHFWYIISSISMTDQILYYPFQFLY